MCDLWYEDGMASASDVCRTRSYEGTEICSTRPLSADAIPGAVSESARVRSNSISVVLVLDYFYKFYENKLKRILLQKIYSKKWH